MSDDAFSDLWAEYERWDDARRSRKDAARIARMKLRSIRVTRDEVIAKARAVDEEDAERETPPRLVHVLARSCVEVHWLEEALEGESSAEVYCATERDQLEEFLWMIEHADDQNDEEMGPPVFFVITETGEPAPSSRA